LIYYGDNYNRTTQKRSFILFRSNLARNEYTVYLYENYYPRSISRVVKDISADD